MKYIKLLVSIFFLINTHVLASNVNPALLLLRVFPQLVDLWLVGAPNNYYYQFSDENYQTIKSGYEFNNLIVFGDSLSDQGSNGRYSMYLAGGYAKLTYVDYLSQRYTGKISKPYSANGLNYAQRGATIEEKLNDNNVIKQVNLYLNNTERKADSNSLYILWGGAMDINIYIGKRIFDIILGRYDLNEKKFAFGQGPQITVKLIQELTHKGASYVFVPNIPDSSLIPYSMMMISEQLIENVLGRVNIPYTWVIGNIGQRVDSYLRDPKNWILSRGEDFVRLNHIRAMQTQIFWYLPKSLVAHLYGWIAKVQKQVTAQYNYSLNEALKEAGENVVYFDFAGFMQEVISNYQKYHIDNVLVPTCTLGYSSRYCDVTSPKFHQGIFLFGDWFHPSPDTHIAISQYIKSIFDAPVYANSIVRQLEAMNASRDFYVQQLNHPYQSKNINQPDWFIGYSGGMSKSGVYVPNNQQNVNLLNIGIKKDLNHQLQMSGMLSFSMGRYKPHDLYNYYFNYQGINLLLQSFWSNHIWTQVNLNVSHLSVRDIVRKVSIFDTELYTKGQTTAYSYGILSKVGKNLIVGDYHRVGGPFIQLVLNRIHAKGYVEKGISAIAMNYDSYHYNKNYIGVGWYHQNNRLSIRGKPILLFYQITLNRNIGPKTLAIPASVKTAPVKFKRQIKIQANRIGIRGGADINLQKNISLSVQYGYSTDFKRNKNINYALGLQYKFLR